MATATRKPATAQEELLSAEFMTRLDRLELLSRKIFAGRMKGERRSKRKGESVEFADYRNYVVGDDLRFLDWNIYARLERLLIKLFMEEEDLNVTVLFDCSRSMDWGDPHKGLYVKRVAAALAYIGLVNYDRVSLYGYSDRLSHEMRGVRGRRLVSQVIRFLEAIPMEGQSNFGEVARRFATRHKGKGVVVVLSDFMDKGGFAAGLRYLLGLNLDLYAVQVLSPDEIDPPLTGDLKLVDVEDEDVAEVTISRPLLTKYKAMLQAYCTELKDYCTQRGITYLFTSTRVPFDTLVLGYLRQRGLIR
ncbi:MAG: DUF58 domain-containing protein [Phycisphaerae bacterium]|jgi:uncharacterized protein (DUF58 family)|nr:DUF58 domain-containing protein [Phycisphaerae bacterium]MCZ2398988.1 DUF58 domain-containing protein [Phycisphaerae bacterium]NUQ48567.1 DUF58 domain-containing protein [Phycisphaerae bacterium]